MASEESCIFCKIVAREADASIVYRDELVTAFMDLQPLVAGHALVIPNRHATDIHGVDETDGGRMIAVARRIAAAMPSAGLRCEGTNFFVANGQVAGQTVFHSHLHVIPRHAGDGFGIKIDPSGRAVASRAALDEQAAALAAGLAARD